MEKPSRNAFRLWIARHEWTIVAGFAVLAFVLAVLGYRQDMLNDPEANGWDILYAAIRLFLFESQKTTPDWPIYFQVARILAPTVLIYAAVKAVSSKVGQEVLLYWLLAHKRRFVVICGIGETGFRMAKEYATQTTLRVIAIDENPDNPLASELKSYNVIVVSANAMSLVTLQKVRAVYAKAVFLFTGDEQVNIAVAKNIERLCRDISNKEIKRLSQPLQCYVSVDAPDLYEVFINHPFFALHSERLVIRTFNRRETVARNVFRLCGPEMYSLPRSKQDKPMHILFLGFEALIRELIIQTALNAHYTDYRLPNATVMCPESSRDLVERFYHRFPHLVHTLKLRFYYADPMTVGEELWSEMQQVGDFTLCYASMSKDVESILSARRLHRLTQMEHHHSLNFIVCLNQQTFLAEILDDTFVRIHPDKSRLADNNKIEYFETLDETINIDMVVNDRLDTMANALHRAYCLAEQQKGESADSNASIVAWKDLPPHKRKANQHAAAHLDVKLRILGLCRADLSDPRPAVSRFSDSTMLEALAQLEHRRWMADKYIAGYRYGIKRDEMRMLHPDILPWEKLSEQDKDKDRRNIYQIAELVALAGQKIVQL